MGRKIKRLSSAMKRYIAGRQSGLDPMRAAEAAGSNHPEVYVRRWEQNPHVQAALEAVGVTPVAPVEIVRAPDVSPVGPIPDPSLTVAPKMGETEILSRLAYHARATFEDFLDVETQDVFEDEQQDDGTIKKVAKRRSYPVFNFLKAKERGALHQIRELKIRAGFSQARDGGEPLPWTETTLKLHDAPTNLERLAKLLHIEPSDPEKARDQIDNELWRRVLALMSTQDLAQLKANLFGVGNNGGNGNGHQ